MSLPKLGSSCIVTSKVISNHNTVRKSKISIEQPDCKLFFRVDGTCNSQWSNYLTQGAEILSPQSNLAPQWWNTVKDLAVVFVVPKLLST